MQEELRVEADLSNLPAISGFVQAVGRRFRLPEDAVFDIDLAVEEASTNIIRHAYRSGPIGDILLRMEAVDDVVRIEITDWGLPLDVQDVGPFDLDAPATTRAKGGTGLHLIRSLMDDVTRRTSPSPGGPNVLILSKRVKR